jgi:GTPase SAR1 family protein
LATAESLVLIAKQLARGMIADSYLQLRNELEAAVMDLLKLAGEMRRTAPWLDMLQSFVTDVRQPLLLAIVGESKSGKSSLLNALFDTDFVGDAESVRICVFQYGRESKSVDATSRLREVYLPATFLRDLKIVDTPGLEKLGAQDRHTVLEFISRADLVLLVLSLRQPWLPASWEFVTGEQLPLKKVVFVLQQADLREPKEIAIIRQNLEDDAKQKLGFIPPIFAISARDALLARSGASPSEQGRHQSEFESLKEQINLVVSQSGGRTQQLRSACQLAQLVLHDITSELRASVESVDYDERRLAHAEALRRVLKEQALRHVNKAFVRLDRIGREQIERAVATVNRKLSPANLVTPLSHSAAWLQRCEADFEATLRRFVEQQTAEIAQVLETELRGLWPQLHDTVDQQLVTEAKEKMPQAGPDVGQHKRDLLEALSAAVSQHHTGDIEQPRQLFLRISLSLRALLIVAALSGAFALVTKNWSSGLAIILAWLALCATGAGALVLWRGQKIFLRTYAQVKDLQMRGLQNVVAEQFKHAIDAFYDAVVEKFRPLIEHCETQRSTSEPLLRRAEDLQRTLIGLSSRLR